MNFFERILAALDGKMTTPTAFGWFHLMCIGIVVALVIVVCFTCKKLTSKQFRTITLVVAITLIVLEIYKQLNYSYNPSSDTWHYQWYAFPFQFCATPMYVLLLIGLVKENKFSNYLCSFMATYGMFAGIVVMLYPGDVFISTIGINIQTMIHHGLMVVMGVFMIVSGRAKLEHKTILKGMAVFGVLCATALLMNLIWHFAGDENVYFNMFYISPFMRCHLPILGNIWDINYILFIFAYLFGFSLAGYLIILVSMGASKLTKLKKRQDRETQQVDGQEDKEKQIQN